jgi:hypothetical protein
MAVGAMVSMNIAPSARTLLPQSLQRESWMQCLLAKQNIRNVRNVESHEFYRSFLSAS